MIDEIQQCTTFGIQFHQLTDYSMMHCRLTFTLNRSQLSLFRWKSSDSSRWRVSAKPTLNHLNWGEFRLLVPTQVRRMPCSWHRSAIPVSTLMDAFPDIDLKLLLQPDFI